MKKHNFVEKYFLISIIILFSFYFIYRRVYLHLFYDIKYDKYTIVCAKYNRDVTFLKYIPIKSVVIVKDIDVPNIAHESTSYLYYIINNYDNLPENLIFIHDENISWHHYGKITINIYKWIDEYQKNGSTYYEFNHLTTPKVTNMKIFDKYWNDVFQESCGNYKDAKPHTGKCCAQFIVSREIIRKRPIELYKKMYDWLINNTHGTGNGDKNDLYSGYYTSRYAEWTWRNLFNPND
jgi:hypothetical protein